jgi:hypothetical protein
MTKDRQERAEKTYTTSPSSWVEFEICQDLIGRKF